MFMPAVTVMVVVVRMIMGMVMSMDVLMSAIAIVFILRLKPFFVFFALHLHLADRYDKEAVLVSLGGDAFHTVIAKLAWVKVASVAFSAAAAELGFIKKAKLFIHKDNSRLSIQLL